MAGRRDDRDHRSSMAGARLGARARRSPGRRSGLHHPDLVAGRVPKPGVDPVRLLRRLLGELDAAALELLVARLAILRREEEAAGRALGDDVLDLPLRLL